MNKQHSYITLGQTWELVLSVYFILMSNERLVELARVSYLLAASFPHVWTTFLLLP